jgi:very-short-patch-repair endonuclease
MTPETTQRSAWALVRRQHGVITRRQLAALGFSAEAIRHRLAKGRLHRLWPAVYAVGRPQVTQEGVWMAAVLSCGDGAALSHASAAALWGIRNQRGGPTHVSVPSPRDPRRRGIRVHRRRAFDVTTHNRISVTSPSQTIIDMAPRLSGHQLERVISEADKLDLVHPDALRQHAAAKDGIGGARVRTLLDRQTFLLTDSDLERRFIPIAERAGLSRAETQVTLHGHRVDFFFRAERLVVETDGLRYHRTPTQQKRDRVRDQELTAAGLRVVRFTHGQIKYESDHVAEVLRRLSSNS